jgi:hypothetical protein
LIRLEPKLATPAEEVSFEGADTTSKRGARRVLILKGR